MFYDQIIFRIHELRDDYIACYYTVTTVTGEQNVNGAAYVVSKNGLPIVNFGIEEDGDVFFTRFPLRVLKPEYRFEVMHYQTQAESIARSRQLIE